MCLIVCALEQHPRYRLIVAANRDGTLQRVTSGFHGLSNHLFDTPWPKVTTAVSGLAQMVRQQNPDRDLLFDLLADTREFADPLLPDTGVGLDRERQLSSLFIRGSHYGTRSSSVVMVGYDGGVEFCERSFDAEMQCTGEVRHILPGRLSGAGQ